jgi:hypothetical protein
LFLYAPVRFRKYWTSTAYAGKDYIVRITMECPRGAP